MDKIVLINMEFYGYHGVLEEEKKKGQYFYIDVEMFCDTSKAGETDGLDDTIDYSKVFTMVEEITTKQKFDLIEKLANVIANTILSKVDKVEEVLVRVRKPHAPIKGEFDYAGVEIKRSKK